MITRIPSYLTKLDNRATDGLSGVSNSLAYRIAEVERHLHQEERWFGAAASPSGETHVADRIGVGVSAFELDAGNNTWGTWVQILGSTDTPADTGNVAMDVHRVLFTNAEKNATYFLQFGAGDSGAAAITAGTYTEIAFQPASNQIDSGPYNMQSRRADTGTKVWARCLCPGQDTGTLEFYVAIHEYEG